ncbi:hypothetical protein IZU27_03675 [Treponema socranskii]|uniref:tetratricopeptide repeat protein n=1 Tax=Treponema socranskii TaxID=53419 RepID=UPI003D8A3962
MKKIVIVFSALLLVYSTLGAQVRPKKPRDLAGDVKLFRFARVEFDVGNYGEALRLANEAKTARREIVAWEADTLSYALKPREVQKANGVLSDVLAVLKKREDYDAVEIVERYVGKKTSAFFNNSADALVSYVSTRFSFPEADRLIGRIYFLEGEYSLAKQYLLNAWQNAALLDIPDERYDILYELSDIALIEKDFDSYEKNLLLIVSGDSLLKNESFERAFMLIVQNNEAGAMEKFFTLFRSKDYTALDAYFKLAPYYEERGFSDKALKAFALGTLTAFTKMHNTVKARDSEFEYRNLSLLFTEIKRFPDIIDWATERQIWKGFSDFADCVRKAGNERFAFDLYTALAASSPDGYWQKRAAAKLANDF